MYKYHVGTFIGSPKSELSVTHKYPLKYIVYNLVRALKGTILKTYCRYHVNIL